MTKMLVHRGTGTWFVLHDDVWVIDSEYFDDDTGEIDDDVLLANGKPIIDVIPDYDY